MGQNSGDRALALDERVLSPYLAFMANRLFITLLALLTGLAAQVGPAQARSCAASSAEIGAVASVMAEGRLAIPESLAFATGAPRERKASEFHALATRSEVRLVPAVLTGIDRARE
ncbi:MAG: hypothetical protein R3E09_08040 [Novosphingobium sp.]|nr:hypothetical protein [Novosphingobium sp.]